MTLKFLLVRNKKSEQKRCEEQREIKIKQGG